MTCIILQFSSHHNQHAHPLQPYCQHYDHLMLSLRRLSCMPSSHRVLTAAIPCWLIILIMHAHTSGSTYNHSLLVLHSCIHTVADKPCDTPVARWLSGRASDVRSKSRGFEARPRRCCAPTLGKLFTPYCLCHQAV